MWNTSWYYISRSLQKRSWFVLLLFFHLQNSFIRYNFQFSFLHSHSVFVYNWNLLFILCNFFRFEVIHSETAFPRCFLYYGFSLSLCFLISCSGTKFNFYSFGNCFDFSVEFYQNFLFKFQFFFSFTKSPLCGTFVLIVISWKLYFPKL